MKKVLFYILFTVAVFLVTVVYMSQKLSDEYQIERDAMIKAPLEEVYAQIGDLKNWQNWSPWKKRDPAMELIFNGDKTKDVGDSYSWKSADSGNGTLTITEKSSPTLLAYKIQFEGWDGTPTGELQLVQMQESVRVVWTMRGHRGFVDKIFWTVMHIEDSIKKDFDDGLLFLKEMLEKK